MNKVFLSLALQAAALGCAAQTLFSDRFNNLVLQTNVSNGVTTSYTNVPAGYSLINDGWGNNPGSLSNPNKPFQLGGFGSTGWAVAYNQADNDTFLVSTSWIDTSLISVDRWVITQPVSGIGPNTVLTWLAKSPDPTYADGYEVYATTKQGPLGATDFAIGDRLFALADANTGGGGEKSTWTRRSVPLGAFAGQSLRFAFRNNSKDMYQLWIDDIEVINVPSSLDGGIVSDIARKYVLKGKADSSHVVLTNTGAAVINTVTMSYQIGNSSINTENFLTGGLAYRQSSLVKFALPFTLTQSGFYVLKSWISAVNGQPDQNFGNDTTRCFVTVQDTTPPKTLLFEQFVSADNGSGTDAQERAMALQSNQVIAVAIHEEDSMRTASAATLIADYEAGVTSAMVDRTYFSDAGAVAAGRPYYGKHLAARQGIVTPASVSIINKSFNTTTRLLSFTVKADFVGEVRGDYRISAYLTENQVGGPVSDTTINGYNQWNDSYTIPWSAYYQKGYYSPVANTYILNLGQYRHQNVLMYAFDNGYGAGGVITGSTQGQSFQQTFTLTVPTASVGVNKFNPDNLYLVGFVAEYNSSDKTDRHILNAVKEKLNGNPEVVSLQELALQPDLFIYPNPSEGIFYFSQSVIKGSYEIGVYDLGGRCLRLVNVANSPTLQPLDLGMLPNGMYLLKISAGGQNLTKKIMIRK